MTREKTICLRPQVFCQLQKRNSYSEKWSIWS